MIKWTSNLKMEELHVGRMDQRALSIESHEPELASINIDQINNSVKSEQFCENVTVDSQDSNEENKNVIEQFVDENGRVWLREEYNMKICDAISMKTEDISLQNKDIRCSSPEMDLAKQSEKDQQTAKQNTNILKENRSGSELAQIVSVEEQMGVRTDNSELNTFTCQLCDYECDSKITLKEHVEKIHLKVKISKCHFCDFSTTGKYLLKQHIDSLHSHLKNFECHLCDFACIQKSRLKIHIDSVHLKLKTHKCHICDYGCASKTTLTCHIQSIHSSLKPFECHDCGMKFPQKGRLKHHIEKVHLEMKNHKCNFCSYASYQESGLIRHVESVHSKLKNHKWHL